jgi:molybdate/tungstate transport system substrate-binding protein
MKKRFIIIILAILIIAIIAISLYYFNMQQSQPLIVYCADAYTIEINELLSLFHNQTGIPVAPVHGGGSLALAREIAAGAYVSAFVSVALEAYTQSYLQSRYSGWAIAFVTDEMSIAYSNATLSNPIAKQIIDLFEKARNTNSSHYYFLAFNNLTSGIVKVGIANPNNDPAGFRGWLVLKIAGYVYANSTDYFVNRIIMNKGNITGSHAAELVFPLVYGQIQFLFIYRSAAIAKKLYYIPLPPQINLGSQKYFQFYSKFSVNLAKGPIYGSPIYLSISIPKDATNIHIAFKFVEFVIDHNVLLAKYGLNPLIPSLLFNSTNVPNEIINLIKSNKIIMAGSLP